MALRSEAPSLEHQARLYQLILIFGIGDCTDWPSISVLLLASVGLKALCILWPNNRLFFFIIRELREANFLYHCEKKY